MKLKLFIFKVLWDAFHYVAIKSCKCKTCEWQGIVFDCKLAAVTEDGYLQCPICLNTIEIIYD